VGIIGCVHEPRLARCAVPWILRVMHQLVIAIAILVGLGAAGSRAADAPDQTPALPPVTAPPAQAGDKDAGGCMPDGACCGGGACTKAAATQPEGTAAAGCPCKRGPQAPPPKVAQ